MQLIIRDLIYRSPLKELFIYAVVGIIIGAVNLLVMHRFAFNWYKKRTIIKQVNNYSEVS